MRSKQDASEFIFMWNQARERCLEWDHPVTGEEGDIQSLIYDNLFNDGDKAELSVLYGALYDQQSKDNYKYRNNRVEFDRQWSQHFGARRDYMHNLFKKSGDI